MPPALLESQFDALEEPQADERPLRADRAAATPRRREHLQQLGIALPARVQAGAALRMRLTWPSVRTSSISCRTSWQALGHITTRRMFSGAAIYCDGVIFALVLRDTLHFKVDDGNRGAYEAEGLSPSATREGQDGAHGAYRRVPERLLDDPDEMLAWARAALAAGRRSSQARRSARNAEAETVAVPQSAVIPAQAGTQ